MFRLKTLLILAMIMGLQVTSVLAESKSFKLTVTIPASVSMNYDNKQTNTSPEVKSRDSQIVQIQQTVRNNTPVTIQSTVIL